MGAMSKPPPLWLTAASIVALLGHSGHCPTSTHRWQRSE